MKAASIRIDRTSRTDELNLSPDTQRTKNGKPRITFQLIWPNWEWLILSIVLVDNWCQLCLSTIQLLSKFSY